jgi:hypothetical protein
MRVRCTVRLGDRDLRASASASIVHHRGTGVNHPESPTLFPAMHEIAKYCRI